MSDPVSAGASVLAFVLLSLKSAKVAHEILSSFKDAPDNVKRASADVQSLVLILERLANCHVLEGHGGEALRRSIDTCRRDIDSFSIKLKGLIPEASNSRRSKYRKRFLTMWDEKALSKMSADLASHTSKLNFHLAVLQRIQETIQMQTQQSHLKTHGLLEQILQHVVRLPLGNQGPGRVVEVQDERAAEEAHLAKDKSCQELMNIITRLCCLVHDIQPQGRLMPREAQDIVGDLLQALELMKSEEFLQAGAMSSMIDQGVCSACCRHHLADFRDTVTTVYSSLWLTRQVTVNAGPYKQSHSTLSAYETTICSLIVLSRRRSRTQRLPQLDPSDAQHRLRLEEEEVITSISLVSGLSPARHGIKISTRQARDYSGVSSAIPEILVHTVPPPGSPVFAIVQQGRLQEFQALLRAGEASLRDQDEYGASLLFYANRQPEMCRYLIQSGADVDHIARLEGVMEYPTDDMYARTACDSHASL
ncbi:hypothetical protein C8A01DRAFT_18873 [Parachaetomium inaequale]|uniref:Azaphilone pigments biosynthesis cluster protein L N-terminal domain-containing protein n=1 Tax=Parachaetomium inaequale TaxID=2588326 RepID=A0AAN6P9M7_9PEZI|nr:hypothetical protein C8A01DRAFT_18873 [Parachaetomium inaequale]